MHGQRNIKSQRFAARTAHKYSDNLRFTPHNTCFHAYGRVSKLRVWGHFHRIKIKVTFTFPFFL